MNSELPPRTDDLSQARRDLDEYGLARVAGALSPADLRSARARLAEQADAEKASGRSYHDSASHEGPAAASPQRWWQRMSFEHILYSVQDRILTITLNRPERMNACTVRMYDELIAAFDRADADDDVKAIIVTGAGKAFCAGADLERGADTWSARSDFTDLSRQERYVGNGGGRIARRIFDCNKPVIAAINGAAVGVGITMTLPMDIRLCVQGAKLGFVFAARGIVPEACSSWFLPRIVGISKALEWCYSAKLIRAEEALAAGLLRSVHAPEGLLPAARALAQEFVQNSSAVSMALTRHMFWRMLGAPHPLDAHEIDTAAMNALGQSQDAKEGITSFLEKRPPRFGDRLSEHLPKFFPWWRDRAFRKL